METGLQEEEDGDVEDEVEGEGEDERRSALPHTLPRVLLPLLSLPTAETPKRWWKQENGQQFEQARAKKRKEQDARLGLQRQSVHAYLPLAALYDSEGGPKESSICPWHEAMSLTKAFPSPLPLPPVVLFFLTIPIYNPRLLLHCAFSFILPLPFLLPVGIRSSPSRTASRSSSWHGLVPTPNPSKNVSMEA